MLSGPLFSRVSEVSLDLGRRLISTGTFVVCLGLFACSDDIDAMESDSDSGTGMEDGDDEFRGLRSGCRFKTDAKTLSLKGSAVKKVSSGSADIYFHEGKGTPIIKIVRDVGSNPPCFTLKKAEKKDKNKFTYRIIPKNENTPKASRTLTVRIVREP